MGIRAHARHVAVGVGIVLVAACAIPGGGGGEELGEPVVGVPGTASDHPAITAAPALDLAPTVATIATGLRIPWGLAFLPDGTALVTERGNPGTDGFGGTARILRVTPTGTVTAVQTLSEVDLRPGEGGLLGIAVSPTYAEDRWVYVYYSATDDNRIARLRLDQPPEPIVTGLPVLGDRSSA